MFRAEAAFGNRFLFHSRSYDSQFDIFFYRARFYDPAIGRFISEDPLRFDGRDANLFWFVGNSPINRIDPTGTSSMAENTSLGANVVIKAMANATRAGIEAGKLYLRVSVEKKLKLITTVLEKWGPEAASQLPETRFVRDVVIRLMYPNSPAGNALYSFLYQLTLSIGGQNLVDIVF